MQRNNLIYKIRLSEKAFEDLNYWNKVDKKKAIKIANLMDLIALNPFKGKGKPEPLKYDFSGYWSRRIDQQHRIVYAVNNDEIRILSCRYHYY